MHGDSRAGQEEGKPPAFLPLRFSGAGQERQGRGGLAVRSRLGTRRTGRRCSFAGLFRRKRGRIPAKAWYWLGSRIDAEQGTGHLWQAERGPFVLEWEGWRRSKAVQLAQTASGMTGDGCKRLVVGFGRGPSQRVGHNRGAKGRSVQQCRRARRRRMQQICHGTAGMKKALAVSCKG